MRNIGGRITPGLLEQLGMLGRIGEVAEAIPGGGGEFHLIVLHHTDCGITRLAKDTNMLAHYFQIREREVEAKSILDPRAAVAIDVAALRAIPALPGEWLISGLVYGRCATDSLRAESCIGACNSFRYGDPFDSAPGNGVHRWKDSGGASLRMTFVFRVARSGGSAIRRFQATGAERQKPAPCSAYPICACWSRWSSKALRSGGNSEFWVMDGWSATRTFGALETPATLKFFSVAAPSIPPLETW